MSVALRTIILAILAIAILYAWERIMQNRRRASPGQAPDERRTVCAFSFQSDLPFAEAAKILGAAGQEDPAAIAAFGRWFERDSAWYDNLLSCHSHLGARMNLYFFDDENILEIKLPSAGPQGADIWEKLESFARNELLPALKARDIKPTGAVN